MSEEFIHACERMEKYMIILCVFIFFVAGVILMSLFLFFLRYDNYSFTPITIFLLNIVIVATPLEVLEYMATATKGRELEAAIKSCLSTFIRTSCGLTAFPFVAFISYFFPMVDLKGNIILGNNTLIGISIIFTILGKKVINIYLKLLKIKGS